MWDEVAAERQALADDLRGLSEDGWATPSWCAGWSVRDVLAHLTSGAEVTPTRFAQGFIRSGFRFDRMIERDLQSRLGASPEETLKGFEAVVDATDKPPGPPLTVAGEILVHAEDIRRPLGITHAYPLDLASDVLSFYLGSNLILGTKRRVEGLQLLAVDTPFSFGAGGRVEGPLMSVLLAVTGRAQACADLEGPGVSILRGRCG